MTVSVPLAGFSLHACVHIDLLLPGRQDPHLLPVISKLFAAIKTDDVRTCLRSGFQVVLLPPAGYGEAHAFVPASEQCVEDFHLSPPDPAIQAECSEGIAYYNHRRFRRFALFDWAASAGYFCYLSSVIKPGFVSLVFHTRPQKHLFAWSSPCLQILRMCECGLCCLKNSEER